MLNRPLSRPALLRALVPLLTLGACDCGSTASLPGPDIPDFLAVPGASVAALGLVPFDVDREDLVGPDSHGAMYGKLPEIIVSPRTGGLDVALRSYADADNVANYVLRFADGASGPTLTSATQAPSLGLLLGFVSMPDGGYAYATGTTEDRLSSVYPAPGVHRTNVVRVYRVSAGGTVAFDVDLDLAREDFDPDAEPIIHPGVASSSRLAVAGGQLALVHGINTTYDSNVSARHQKALSTYLDATTGDITSVAGIWCSHSFDQRYLVDGNDLFELHLGDAYPRAVVGSRVRGGDAGGDYRFFVPKGMTGNNNTYTRLGGIARVGAGPGTGAYLVLFATERSTSDANRVNSSRELTLVRAVSGFADGSNAMALDGAFGTRYLTDYDGSSSSKRHAERPKLLALSGGTFLVLWEQWLMDPSQTFEGTYAMRIDGDGTVGAAATRVSDHHLPRGDDAFVYGGEGCWMTGDSANRTLTLHCVASDLSITEAVVP